MVVPAANGGVPVEAAGAGAGLALVGRCLFCRGPFKRAQCPAVSFALSAASQPGHRAAQCTNGGGSDEALLVSMLVQVHRRSKTCSTLSSGSSRRAITA
jgi:hypothetical protein